jgi:uncharacterized protein (TIGR00369 family)
MSANKLRRAYDTLAPLPGGKRIFSQMVGRMAPYTGTIGARVLHLSEGHAEVEMRDRKAVRNHLDSVHAIALMNLAEVTTGLAALYAMPEEARSILKGLSIDYLKKGRGTLRGVCRCAPITTTDRQEVEIVGEIFDDSGDLVARARALWLIGPKR